MATEVIKIVDPDNGAGTDYTSLAAAIAGEARDLVTADEQLTIKCRCTGGTADTAATLEGFTVNSSCYVKIWTDPTEGYRHSGVPVYSGKVYRIHKAGTSSTRLLYIRNYYTRVEGILFTGIYTTTTSNKFVETVYNVSRYCTIESCVFAASNYKTTYAFIVIGDYTIPTIRNCAFWGVGTSDGTRSSIVSGTHTNGSGAIIDNCTSYSENYSSFIRSSYTRARNNISIHPSGANYYGTYGESDNNVSYDTSAPGTTVAVSQTDPATYFTDVANADLSLTAASATLFGISGADLGATFTTDILGNSRTSPWDIGAFEYVSAGYSLTSDNGSFILTGQSATPKTTRVVAGENGSFTLSGQAAGLLNNKLVGAEYSQFLLTGQDSVLKSARVIGADSGSYAFTGQEVTLEYLVSLTLSAGYGQFTLSGQDVNTLYSKLVSASLAEFTLTGQTALFKYSKSLDAGYGGYSFTGQSANLLKALKVAAERGSFDLTGQNATLVYTPVGGYTIVASQGTFSLAGQSADLLRASRISSQYGSFSLSGQDSLFRVGKLVSAEPGVYQLSGQDLSFLRTHVLTSEAGLYILSGQDAGLVYVPHEELVVLAETGIFTLIFPNVLLKYSSEYAVTCSKVFKAPILAILYANSEIISEVLDKSKISKELVYNERDICW